MTSRLLHLSFRTDLRRFLTPSTDQLRVCACAAEQLIQTKTPKRMAQWTLSRSGALQSAQVLFAGVCNTSNSARCTGFIFSNSRTNSKSSRQDTRKGYYGSWLNQNQINNGADESPRSVELETTRNSEPSPFSQSEFTSGKKLPFGSSLPLLLLPTPAASPCPQSCPLVCRNLVVLTGSSSTNCFTQSSWVSFYSRLNAPDKARYIPQRQLLSNSVIFSL